MPEVIETDEDRFTEPDTVVPLGGRSAVAEALDPVERSLNLSSLLSRGAVVTVISGLAIGLAIAVPEPLSILLLGSVLFTSTAIVKRRMRSSRS